MNLQSQQPSFLWANHKTQTSEFNRYSFGQLAELAHIPDSYAKKSDVPVFLPTLASAKTKDAVFQADAQTALILDLDDGGWTEVRLRSELASYTCNYLCYSTWSSQDNAQRWRVVIPLLAPINIERWVQCQEFLCAEFGGDSCAIRIYQPSHAPAYNQEGFYTAFSECQAGFLDVNDHRWSTRVDDYQATRLEQERLQLSILPVPTRANTGYGELDRISSIKSAYSLRQLLLQSGFISVGKKLIPPESSSGSPGVIVFDDDQHGYCHNTSCPLHSEGKRFDVIDVLLHYRYSNSWEELFRVECPDNTYSSPTEHQQRVCKASPIDASKQALEPYQLARFAKEVATHAQYPVFSATLTALGAFSALISAVYCVSYPDGDRLSVGLYTCTEQPPGSAKSRVLGEFTRPILREIREAATADTENSSNASPVRAQFFASNITPEALEERMLLPNKGHFSLASAEQGLSDVLLGYTRGADRKNDNDILLKGFAGEWHSSSRITRDGFQGVVHGAITLVAQPGTIEKVLDGSHGQGVAERFLFLSEPTLIGKRQFLSQPEFKHRYRQQYQRGVGVLTGQLAAQPSVNLEQLKVLTIDSTGWEHIAQYRQKMEPLLADGQPFSHGILRGTFGKVDMQIMKVAAVLHVSECVMMGSDVTMGISNQCVLTAIFLTDYLLHNTASILETKGRFGAAAECDAILRIFKAGEVKTERQIIQSRSKVEPFTSMTGSKSKAVRQAIERCVEQGLIKVVSDEQKREAYTVA